MTVKQNQFKRKSIPQYDDDRRSIVGWCWERKEIENYLIDPLVVERALAKKKYFAIDDYRNALTRAVESLRFYTAARTALSCFQFSNRLGRQNDCPPFKSYSFPEQFHDKSYCLGKLSETVQRDAGKRAVSEADVTQKFHRLVGTLDQEGERYNYPLVYHSGKDLLLAMKKTYLDQCMPSQQNSVEFFLERIITAIERDRKPWNWLPEWSYLRQALSTSVVADSS